MKTYINKLADYREAPFEREVTISCPQEYIDSQMKHLTRSHKKNVPVKILEKGDVTVLALESKLEKFNRPSVFVTVGGGIFSPELEAQLIGHEAGETFTATVDGEEVRVTVKQATRAIFPEPTDEMAAQYAASHDDYADCTTVEKYKEKIVNDYLEQERNGALYGGMNQILEYVLTNSDWEFDEEELQAWIAEAKAEYLQETGKNLEDMTREEMEGALGVSTHEEMEKVLYSEAERTIAQVLWRAAVAGQETADKSIYELMDEQDWDFLENFVKENITVKEEK